MTDVYFPGWSLLLMCFRLKKKKQQKNVDVVETKAPKTPKCISKFHARNGPCGCSTILHFISAASIPVFCCCLSRLFFSTFHLYWSVWCIDRKWEREGGGMTEGPRVRYKNTVCVLTARPPGRPIFMLVNKVQVRRVI